MTPDSLTSAFDFAENLHRNRKWKNGEITFLHHPIGVASLVLFYGGDQSQAQAALLHDTLGEGATLTQIQEKFGKEVRELVEAFEDPPGVNSQTMEWANIKKAYISKIETLPTRAVFVIACEELHEITTLNQELKSNTIKVWKHYPVPGRDLGWYFKNLASVFYKKLDEPKYQSLVSEFATQTKILSNRVFEGIEG
jgi:(p)ppGpp synthase/HD superfamily hydrolase